MAIRKRAVLLVGAGASVEYGIPTTVAFGREMDTVMESDEYIKYVNAGPVYFDIKRKLADYYNDESEANFERIYHVLHELETMIPYEGAVPKYKPVIFPFIELINNYDRQHLRNCAHTMLDGIYQTISSVCKSPKIELQPLKNFLAYLESQYVVRIYTTNYDDFFEQASDFNLFTGFVRETDDISRFNPKQYFNEWNNTGIFHLHGCVHMGFLAAETRYASNEIAWYTSIDEALKNYWRAGSGTSRMDGTQVQPSCIITGLDKLSRLQQSPFSYYYQGFFRDVMEADIIFVIGSGLSDLHLNSCLREARLRNPQVPIIYIGYWPGADMCFYSQMMFEHGDLETSIFHDLLMDFNHVNSSAFKATDGWTLDSKKTGAIWADGFQNFLNNQNALDKILKILHKNGVPSRD